MSEHLVPATEPATAGLAAPHTEGLRQHRVRFQRCSACGHAVTLARYACPACGSPALDWHTAQGHGRVEAVTEVARPPSEAFRALAPYTLVLVRLHEGARLMGHAQPGVRIGDAVQAGFFEHGGRTLLRFVPAAPA